MNILKILTPLFIIVTLTPSSILLDCNFEKVRRRFCGWKRERLGSRRAGWRIGNRIRRKSIKDHTSSDGKFAYILSKSRHVGFKSRLRSPAMNLSTEACFVFWIKKGGIRSSHSDKHTKLKTYLVEKQQPTTNDFLIWTDEYHKPSKKFERVKIALNSTLLNRHVQLVIEATHAKSKNAYAVIDDVSIQPCTDSTSTRFKKMRRKKKRKSKKKNLLIRTLAARHFAPKIARVNPRKSKSAKKFVDYRGKSLNKVATRGKRIRLKKEKKWNENKRNKNKRITPIKLIDDLKNEHFQEKVVQFHESNDGAFLQDSSTCNFLTYTDKLQRCFHMFFENMQNRKNKKCSIEYKMLEGCVISAASFCVPRSERDFLRVSDQVEEVLQNSFQTEKVFCDEEWAFIYPKFSLNKLPIHCGEKYFYKLQECSVSFTELLKIQLDNPHLCREYKKAGECQKRVTFEECRFDTETMILNGLKLQYQFSYNPFCSYF